MCYHNYQIVSIVINNYCEDGNRHLLQNKYNFFFLSFCLLQARTIVPRAVILLSQQNYSVYSAEPIILTFTQKKNFL